MGNTMFKSMLKSMEIYAVIGIVLLGSGKLLETGINTLIDASNQMNDVMNYCITVIVDNDDVK